MEAGSEITALSAAAVTATATGAAAAAAAVTATATGAAAAVTVITGITILPILQKAAAPVIPLQSQRIYLGHLLRTAEVGK